MADERVSFVVRGQRFDPENPDVLLVEIFCTLSSPVRGFVDGATEVRVDTSLTESQIEALLVEGAALYVMSQTVPNVYTAADVRRVA